MPAASTSPESPESIPSASAAAGTDNRHGGVASHDVTWTELRARAEVIREHAYAPYSKFPVGAAAVTDTGRIIVGCNVENASYGLTLCAECSLVSALRASGDQKLLAFVCVNGAGELLMPCGRCRQLLLEFAAPEFRILTARGPLTLRDLLPDAFGPNDLIGARA